MEYLAVVGVVPLRFAPPPAPATPRPPKPDAAPDSTSPKSTALPPVEKTEPNANAAQPKSEPVKNSAAPNSGESTPVSILPDDTPRDVHAEDVLPYFQMPKGDRANSGMTVPFTPAKPTLPVSSATYELK